MNEQDRKDAKTQKALYVVYFLIDDQPVNPELNVLVTATSEDEALSKSADIMEWVKPVFPEWVNGKLKIAETLDLDDIGIVTRWRMLTKINKMPSAARSR